MLLFLENFSDTIGLFNVFRYQTFRAGGAVLTALLIVFLFGPALINWLKFRQGKGQPIRSDGPQGHLLTKKGTPTMGGLMILLGTVPTTLLWCDLGNAYVWIVLFVVSGYGAIGFYDDYLKITQQSNKGYSGKQRVLFEFLIAIVALILITNSSTSATNMSLAFPFFKDVLLNLGLFYVVFGALVILGLGNAVNFTDGLDGLAIVPVMIASAALALIAYVVGNTVFSDYLQLNYIAGAGELTIVLATMIGSGLGFLWFNAPPAQIYMGDTGSLALGGGLGTVAVITKHELVMAVIGGLFVLEVASVIVQIISFKLTGKRIFRMAPIHHHFELKGWSESQIVMRFWIIAVVLALVGLSTLKLR